MDFADGQERLNRKRRNFFITPGGGGGGEDTNVACAVFKNVIFLSLSPGRART